MFSGKNGWWISYRTVIVAVKLVIGKEHSLFLQFSDFQIFLKVGRWVLLNTNQDVKQECWLFSNWKWYFKKKQMSLIRMYYVNDWHSVFLGCVSASKIAFSLFRIFFQESKLTCQIIEVWLSLLLVLLSVKDTVKFLRYISGEILKLLRVYMCIVHAFIILKANCIFIATKETTIILVYLDSRVP